MKKTHRHKYIADKWISYNKRLKSKRCRKNRASNIDLIDKGILGSAFEKEILDILNNIFPRIYNRDIEDFLRSEKTAEEIETFVEKNKKQIIHTTHRGFKIAQNLIIKNLLYIQSEILRLGDIYKEIRVKKVGNPKVISFAIKNLKYKETIIKNLADTIVWQLAQQKLYIVRRFYQNVAGSKNLEETNYESVLHVANLINKNPDNFVLLTDLASNFQIGDLFGIINGVYQLIEVKEGDRNHNILETIMSIPPKELTDDKLNDIFSSKKDLEQAKRMLKQAVTASSEINIIRHDKGFDPVSKKKIVIRTPDVDTQFYDEHLSSLEQQLMHGKLWGYTVIDDCLHIGLYKGYWKYLGVPVLKQIAKMQGITHPLIVDCRSVMHSLDEPIFYLPFSKATIMDIVSEKAIMYLLLDLDKFMALYSEYGAVSTWISHKVANKIGITPDPKLSFEFNHKLIKIKNIHGVEYILAKGSICKILFDHIRPRYVALSSMFLREP